MDKYLCHKNGRVEKLRLLYLIQIYSESARRFVTCWIDFRKNEVIDYNNLNYTIKELIAKAKPEVVLFFYKSGELYFDDDQERIYRKQAIEEWCKQNAK